MSGRPALHHPPAGRESLVYFIQAEQGGLIKIGTTTNVRERLRDLQVMSPVSLCLLGVFPGSVPTEQALHLRFNSLRRYGEWFEPDESLLAFVESFTVPIRLSPLHSSIDRSDAELLRIGRESGHPCRECGREAKTKEGYCRDCLRCHQCHRSLYANDELVCADCLNAFREACGVCIECRVAAATRNESICDACRQDLIAAGEIESRP